MCWYLSGVKKNKFLGQYTGWTSQQLDRPFPLSFLFVPLDAGLCLLRLVLIGGFHALLDIVGFLTARGRDASGFARLELPRSARKLTACDMVFNLSATWRCCQLCEYFRLFSPGHSNTLSLPGKRDMEQPQHLLLGLKLPFRNEFHKIPVIPMYPPL